MDVFDFAMQMEKDGENYYRDLASRSPDTGLANILLRLADAEVKHFEILQQMKAGQPAALERAIIPDGAKNLFAELKERGRTFDMDGSQVDFYRTARELETESRSFYLAKADEAGSADASDIFVKLAEEEKLHEDMLDSIIEFVSVAEPGNWLENAEWYHSESY